MDGRRFAKIMVALSLLSVVVAAAGIAFGFPFFALFLFFPGFLSWGISRKGEDPGGDQRPRCPECGAPMSPDDLFCSHCGRNL